MSHVTESVIDRWKVQTDRVTAGNRSEAVVNATKNTLLCSETHYPELPASLAAHQDDLIAQNFDFLIENKVL